MENGVVPVADDELLYRRIPVIWYDSSTGTPKPEAFAPHKTRDITGLSVSRARFKSLEQAARGMPGKSYYVAVLRAGDLRQAGLAVEPRPETPDGYDVSHAELPDLNSATYKDDVTLERQRILVTLCRQVAGPFETPQG